MSRDSGPSDCSEVRDDFGEYLRTHRINEWIRLRPESKRQATIDWIQEICGYEYTNRPQTPTASGPLSPPTSADRAKIRESSFVSQSDIAAHNLLMGDPGFHKYVIQPDEELEMVPDFLRFRLVNDVKRANQPDILSAFDINLYCQDLELSGWLPI